MRLRIPQRIAFGLGAHGNSPDRPPGSDIAVTASTQFSFTSSATPESPGGASILHWQPDRGDERLWLAGDWQTNTGCPVSTAAASAMLPSPAVSPRWIFTSRRAAPCDSHFWPTGGPVCEGYPTIAGRSQSRPSWVVAGAKPQGTPRGRDLGGHSEGAEAATRPGALCLAALWACRVAPADKLSDDKLSSYEAGACDQAGHWWQRGFGQCAAR